MKKPCMPRITLLNRILLFLAAFAAALVLQIGIGQYQTRYVLEPMEDSMAEVQSISAFLNDVESILQTLSDYRWDYGEEEVLIVTLHGLQDTTEAHFQQIDMGLGQTSEEQYLLANAAGTTYGTFSGMVGEIRWLVGMGKSPKAAELYYDKAQSCGAYTRQYTQQLLEQAIRDNQSEFSRMTKLNERLELVQTVLVMLCVILGIAVTVSLLTLLRLVKDMSRASAAISRGELDTPDVDASLPDEVGHMAATFNEMKHSMKQQVQLLREKNEMERQTLELQALMEREKLQQLRSQINPHFLFNTLNVIMYTAQQEGAGQTKALLNSLSKLFRYTLASNEVQVPLSQEVHIVNEFFSLYHVRFGDRMQLRWEFSPQVDLTETLVPSFILQPIVENALKHGLGRKEEGGTVVLRVWEEGSVLRIEVEDDGVGMPEETLARLREKLNDPPVNGEHIGMYNVAARLRLCGEGYGLEIRSVEGKGTTVALRLPLVMTEEEEPDD